MSARCKYGATINSCEFGYPGCVCADDAMVEVERMATVPHPFEPGGQYGTCWTCDRSREAAVHQPVEGE